VANEDVQVRFGAQIDGLIAGINDAKSQLQSITDPISGIKDAFSGLAEVAGAAFAVDKLVEFETRYADLGEQIERTAKILGESTDNIQLFSIAMKMAGGDADSAGMTLNILQKNIGDAISKAGPARTAFDNMGFSLQHLKDTDIVTLLFEIKQRMDEAGTSAEQSALKQEYLRTVAGRQAAQFLALGLSFEQVKKIAAETGVVMSPGMTAQAKSLADSTHELSLAWTGLSDTIASKVAPAYQWLIDKTTALIEGQRQLLAHPLGPLFSPMNVKGTSEEWQGSVGQMSGGGDLGEGQFGPNMPTNPLPQLGKDQSGAQDDTAALYKQDIQDQLALDKFALQQKTEMLDQEVAQQVITNAQKIDALKDFAAQAYALDMQALADMETFGDLDEKEWNKVEDEKLAATAKFNAEIAKLNAQAATAQVEELKKTQEEYKAFFDTIDKDMDEMLSGILRGTQTWQQAVERLFSNLISSLIEDIAKLMVKWAAFEAASAVSPGGNLAQAFGKDVPQMWGGSQPNNQNALTALLTTLTTAITGNTAAQTMMQAVSEYNTAAAQAGLPIIEGLNTATLSNTTATLANTIAEQAGSGGAIFGATGLGIAGIPLFEDGTMSAPGGLSILHPGEIVIPAAQSAAIRSGAASIGGSGGGDYYSVNINAVDSQSFVNLLQTSQGQQAIVGIISNQARNNNSKLRNLTN